MEERSIFGAMFLLSMSFGSEQAKGKPMEGS